LQAIEKQLPELEAVHSAVRESHTALNRHRAWDINKEIKMISAKYLRLRSEVRLLTGFLVAAQ
jgi:hypothetical protein